jgi:hypothetical protein
MDNLYTIHESPVNQGLLDVSNFRVHNSGVRPSGRAAAPGAAARLYGASATEPLRDSAHSSNDTLRTYARLPLFCLTSDNYHFTNAR